MNAETLKARLSTLSETMLALNDELARLQGQARAVETALLETSGQRKELQFLIREIETEGKPDA